MSVDLPIWQACLLFYACRLAICRHLALPTSITSLSIFDKFGSSLVNCASSPNYYTGTCPSAKSMLPVANYCLEAGQVTHIWKSHLKFACPHTFCFGKIAIGMQLLSLTLPSTCRTYHGQGTPRSSS